MENIDCEKLVKIYNESGKEKTIEFIKSTYTLSTRTVFEKLNKAGYKYNGKLKKYEKTEEKQEEITPFMSIEELYGNENKVNSEAMLMQQLLKEKLFSMLRYVNIDFANKEVKVHKKLLVSEGYKILDV